MSIWRIRMNTETTDYSEQAWNNDTIGIWWGAWTADQFNEAVRNLGDEPNSIAKYLSELPAQKALWPVPPKGARAVCKLHNIDSDGWVIVYFSGRLGLARVTGPLM